MPSVLEPRSCRGQRKTSTQFFANPRSSKTISGSHDTANSVTAFLQPVSHCCIWYVQSNLLYTSKLCIRASIRIIPKPEWTVAQWASLLELLLGWKQEMWQAPGLRGKPTLITCMHFCKFSCIVKWKNDEDRALTEDVEATSDSFVFPKMMRNLHRKCLTVDIGIYVRFLLAEPLTSGATGSLKCRCCQDSTKRRLDDGCWFQTHSAS